MCAEPLCMDTGNKTFVQFNETIIVIMFEFAIFNVKSVTDLDLKKRRNACECQVYQTIVCAKSGDLPPLFEKYCPKKGGLKVGHC
jgi:hypothetical protein